MTPDNFIQRWLMRGDGNNPKDREPRVLYKYLNQEYIDNFFLTGEIKLGTFNAFKHIEDNNRADYQEGTNEYKVWNKNRSFSWTLRRSTGDHNFIFCTSTSNDFETIGKNRFGCNGYFKITNSLGFAYEIAKVIKGFTKGLEGPALYSETGETDFFTEMYNVPDFDNTTYPPELYNTFHLISEINFDLCFSKRSLYSMENEYRLVWGLDHNAEETELIIKCPGALRFCEKIT